MKEESMGQWAPIGVAVVLGILFGALWTKAQSVSPMRFDEPAPVVRAAVDGGSQILDAYLATVASPAQGSATVTVPTARIRERCNDGDGCLVRLFLSSAQGSSAAGAVKVKFFSTTALSTLWRLHGLEDGVLEASGSTTDGTTHVIEFLFASDRGCHFQDHGPTGAYHLVAQNQSPQSVSDCVLRIDD